MSKFCSRHAPSPDTPPGSLVVLHGLTGDAADPVVAAFQKAQPSAVVIRTDRAKYPTTLNMQVQAAKAFTMEGKNVLYIPHGAEIHDLEPVLHSYFGDKPIPHLIGYQPLLQIAKRDPLSAVRDLVRLGTQVVPVPGEGHFVATEPEINAAVQHVAPALDELGLRPDTMYISLLQSLVGAGTHPEGTQLHLKPRKPYHQILDASDPTAAVQSLVEAQVLAKAGAVAEGHDQRYPHDGTLHTVLNLLRHLKHGEPEPAAPVADAEPAAKAEPVAKAEPAASRPEPVTA